MTHQILRQIVLVRIFLLVLLASSMSTAETLTYKEWRDHQLGLSLERQRRTQPALPDEELQALAAKEVESLSLRTYALLYLSQLDHEGVTEVVRRSQPQEIAQLFLLERESQDERHKENKRDALFPAQALSPSYPKSAPAH